MDAIPTAVWLKIAEGYGVPTLVVVMIIVFSIIVKSYESQWRNLLNSQAESRKADDDAREKDRVEHMKKWDSMIKDHVEERDRQFKLYLRLTEAWELQAMMTQRLSDKIENNYSTALEISGHVKRLEGIVNKIDTNKFCPLSK